MSAGPTGLILVVLSGDPHFATQLEDDLRASSVSATVTAAKDLAALHRTSARRPIDAVIIETKRGRSLDLARLPEVLDPSQTLILAGSRGALRAAARSLFSMTKSSGSSRTTTSKTTLEDYLDARLSEFVRDMKHGSARNLHSILIKAVERPLICHALRETNGNQIKTADLLGMNRNTLRKKIAELHIPVQRKKRAHMLGGRSSARVRDHATSIGARA